MAHDLQERVKEQIAILRVTETLFKYPDVHAVFKDCLLHIRDGWQFPEVTAVRIKLNNGEVYTTDDFRETEWGLSAQIDGVHQQHGTLEVYYLEEVPTYAGGIFLYEEERLIGILAKLLSLFLEQWNAINKARASEALMRKITSQVPANTYQFEIEEDGSFKIHFTSKGVEQVNHPFDTEDIIINPQMIVEVIHEEDRPRFYEALAEGRRTQDFISVHYRIVVGNQVRWRWLRATPEKTESGRVLWYGSSQDITPLVDYIGTQEQILFDISHVIRRPLASLLGLCSLMKNKNLTETEVRDLAAKVLDVAGELDDFVKHLNKVYDEKKLLDEVSKFEFTFIDKRDELFNLNES
ncbi:MAG: hypothetical protein KDD36_14460 [Flavobacteriales bacterium]|nr:hypothetical protein [Flavobacteriales bacterium]